MRVRWFPYLFMSLGLSFGPNPRATAEDKLPLKGAVIVVDPGHGGQSYSKSYTGGTRGIDSKLTESELNLKVAFELAKILREKGATVHMTREADHRLSSEGSSNKDELHARVDFFEHYNCHFFLSVHHNAGGPTSSGHTALFKHNAEDDTLYEAIAADVNNALEGAVPGPKLKLIKGSYHILRETPIPGTISESGFMTHKDYDTLCNTADYPKAEATAIAKGAIRYWTDHKEELVILKERLQKGRNTKPRDPKAYTANALNPAYQERMRDRLRKISPGGKYDGARIGDYLVAFQKEVVTDPAATFAVKGSYDGKTVRLTGEVSAKKHHDQLIDVLVAMKLYAIANEVKFPKPLNP